ncbi:accessory Sec system translocase SecA2 [Nocardiopsis gilva YIM 90087]|uniref:Protein translocase subunit SecA n=2 Tax=Nocardiopsis gilva TaxID=280236 RepID=A0A223SCI5_9ACTN|nr:accessory Sec system translocase SecA2 [Nocardiopsis gilva YIM 90087]
MALFHIHERVMRLLDRPGHVDMGRFERVVEAAGTLGPPMRELSGDELRHRAEMVREASCGGTDPDPAELCALGREAARRVLGERAFDVQLLGALGMLAGNVVEMATGEGKTLVGAMTAVGYALRGHRVHVMSVNDYLARRDAEWMRPVFELLGVSASWVAQDSSWSERRDAYSCDVVYGSVSEFGFDVLRDRLREDPGQIVQPRPDVAIVDEADAVLVDEARVPLVLAGAAGGEDDGDTVIARIVAGLTPDLHYEVGEDGLVANLTDAGLERVEEELGGLDLYTDAHADTLSRVNVALYAHALLRPDVDYIVRDGAVQLVSASRGRVAMRQRWPDGLHAAVEAKERVASTGEAEVLDWMLVQALVGRYERVCGMSGTAMAACEQLREFYRLDVGRVPTNRPCIREDRPDRVYATTADKEEALVEHVAEVHANGRPVLIGTMDIAESERLAGLLRREGMRPTVLNAKNDAEEARIIAEAGTFGAVTVSTQMAGRGTDIRLGGADGADHSRIAGLGGLHVVGSSRYYTRRLDDQLRGRAGRQGDPGSSVFFLSLEDELITRNVPDLRHPPRSGPGGLLDDRRTKFTAEHAQRVAEGAHLDVHRTTWRYNQLLQIQRDEVLAHRDELMRGPAAANELAGLRAERYSSLLEEVGRVVLEEASRVIFLFHLDQRWSEHLGYLSAMREGIHLRALGRESPLNAFHREAVAQFRSFFDDVRDRAAATFDKAEITADGVDTDAAGLNRPTSTWTYMVHDNPFGDPEERFLEFLGSIIRYSIRGKD